MTEPLTELHGRKIAFPAANSLSDLFSEVKPVAAADMGLAPAAATFPSWEAGTWSDRDGRTRCTLCGALTVDDAGRYRWFYATPRPDVVAHVEGNMIHGANDTITFRAIVWGDGRALVTAQYGQIIGSSYLAVIDASTIPPGLGEQ